MIDRETNDAARHAIKIKFWSTIWFVYPAETYARQFRKRISKTAPTQLGLETFLPTIRPLFDPYMTLNYHEIKIFGFSAKFPIEWYVIGWVSIIWIFLTTVWPLFGHQWSVVSTRNSHFQILHGRLPLYRVDYTRKVLK